VRPERRRVAMARVRMWARVVLTLWGWFVCLVRGAQYVAGSVTGVDVADGGVCGVQASQGGVPGSRYGGAGVRT